MILNIGFQLQISTDTIKELRFVCLFVVVFGGCQQKFIRSYKCCRPLKILKGIEKWRNNAHLLRFISTKLQYLDVKGL